MSKISYTISELMACIFAREIKDGELGGCPGVRSEVPLASVRLAQMMHAPNVNCYYGAIVYNAHGPLQKFATEYDRIIKAEASVATYEWFDTLHRGDLDFFFIGGLQVDMYGNLNLVCLGDWNKPILRGPGSAGLNSVTFARRHFIWINEHARRVFAPKVDFISSPGYLDGPGAREKAGLRWGGPSIVVSPLGVMDFEPESKRMRLRSVHPGVPVEEVVENTGFELIIPSNVPETPAPSEEELRILRTLVDPIGILRNEEPVG